MLLFNACDDFLDVRPKSEKVENEQFKDAQGFEDAIYGVYGELQNTYSYGRFMYWGFTEVLAQNLAAVFERPAWDISFHVNMDAAALIGSDTFHDGRVTFRPGPVYCCAQSGGFGILDEINMARNEALAVLHSVLDFRRVIDVPGYDRIEVADDTRFIATMNYNYAGTRELNEALASRFVVIQMPPLAKEDLERLLKDQFPSLVTKYNKQFALLFNELQKKCENGELTEKALDLRGLIDAISLIKKGIPIRDALDLGITNKIFDSYEKELIRDVIASRFPLKLHNTEVFE